jgi:hypothetical protein
VQLNAPESQLMSLGCGVFIYSPKDTGEARWSAFSYVGYGFADLAQATDARVYFPHFFHFSRHFANRTNTGAHVLFELREASFIERSAGVFAVDYGVRSYGESPEHLQGIVTDHFNALSEFLPLAGLTPSGRDQVP